MNITVQQFNDVVTGANTHRLLLQVQVNEKIAEIQRLREGLREVQVENMRLANKVAELESKVGAAGVYNQELRRELEQALTSKKSRRSKA